MEQLASVNLLAPSSTGVLPEDTSVAVDPAVYAMPPGVIQAVVI